MMSVGRGNTINELLLIQSSMKLCLQCSSDTEKTNANEILS